MVQKMTYGWKFPWSTVPSNNYFVIKLGISVLLVGLAFRILYGGFSPILGAPFVDKSHISTPTVTSIDSQENREQIPPQGYGTGSTNAEEKCNLFNGDWIPYMRGPSYTNNTCSFIEDHQNCMKNGRPDSDYLYWRWKPHACDLPRLDASRFLRLKKNTNWAWIGDSISRNHVQSFLCILSTVDKPIEVYHDENYKNRKWIFPSYNLSVSLIWSPFLAKATTFEVTNGNSNSEVELQLDILDKSWTDLYKKLDYMIISCGKWFLTSAIYYEKDSMLGCHNSKRNCTELGFNFAYRKVLRMVFDYILESNHKGTIFYRTSTPDHFENGEWFDGGNCKRKVPAKEGEFELSEVNKILRTVEMEEFEKASVKASENGINLKLFDVSPLSLLRSDGHPGAYRYFQPYAKDKDAKVIYDCLHWCLPGPVDAWNDLLMEMVVNG